MGTCAARVSNMGHRRKSRGPFWGVQKGVGGTPGLDLFDDLGVQKNGTLLFYPHGPKGGAPKGVILDPRGVPPPEGGKGRVWQTHVNLGVFLTPFGTPRGDPLWGWTLDFTALAHIAYAGRH